MSYNHKYVPTAFSPLLLASVLMVSGCQVATVPSYQISSNNIIKLKKELSDRTLAVGDITLGKNVNTHMLCRLSGPIVLPGNVSIQSYLKDAIQKEMLVSGVFHAEADNQLNINITRLDFLSSVPAYWTIDAHVSSTAYPTGYNVHVKHRFHTSWIAENACANTADALVTTVQTFIGKVIDHDDFKNLAPRLTAPSKKIMHKQKALKTRKK
jgi:hypothetical protein